MEAAVLEVVQAINSYLSNYVLLILLIGAGLFFTIRTRGVQFRCFGEGWKKMFGEFSLSGGDRGGSLSSFQAVATAIAAQVGTGNIVGACGAILIGGPGAIFWMWIIALLGMATNYAEATLAQKTKVVDADGTTHGGPAYYITTAFKGGFGKFLAAFFAVAVVIALGFIGPMVQSNSIGETMNHAFNIPTWVVGLFVAVFAGFIFIGNLHRLASVTEKLVPIMAVLYIAGSVVVLCMNASHLGEAFGMIFTYAFNPSAGLGGAFFGIWAAITQGAKRGLFSNEAGMGSTPHAHALADVKDPHDQGVVAMIGVFIDTIVVVSMTALVVISVLYTGDGPLATAYENAGKYDTVAEFVAAEGDSIVEGYTLNADGELVNEDGDAVLTNDDLTDPAAIAGAIGISKTNMAQIAFGAFMTESGGAVFICICLLFFAFSTILSWNLFAKLNVQYLFRKRNDKIPVLVFAIIAAVFTFMGTVLQNDIVWELQDMFNQLMVLPNVIALVALSGWVVKCSLARGTKTEEIMAEEL